MDKLTRKLYKKHHICSTCEEPYGSDYNKESGMCPICTEKLSDRKSRLQRVKEREKLREKYTFDDNGYLVLLDQGRRKKKRYKNVYKKGRKK